MTSHDPITAALQELAAHHEHLTQLDTRETGHYTTLSERLAELTDLITDLAAHLTPDSADAEGYQPDPAPAWWKLPAAERHDPITRLQAWVEQVYRPGYGHLATATLAPCWPAHDLCLYGLDILSTLWSVLYLQPERNTRLLSAQAEYQARILPALAEQMGAETAACSYRLGRARALAYARHGWPVFPCLPGEKIPATPAWLPRRHHRPGADHRLVRRQVPLEPGHRHRHSGPRRPGHRPARPRRKRLRSLRRAAPCWTGRRRYRLRADPSRRNARLLHRLRPAQ